MNMTRANKISPKLAATSNTMSNTVATKTQTDTNAIPLPNYSKLSERLRQTANPQFQCAMFCGGRKCKYECSSNWSDDHKALPGIFSHWVTESILAMARPNMENMQIYNLIYYFQQNNIKSIINLEEPGEHANCGNALCSSGFSYEPTVFMENDVYFYNFQWKDYSIVSDEVLLDMVKVMTFALTEGKVAVHCHAGLGRTGVLIAAYLVYAFRCKPQEAIRYVRSKRPNSIQTRGQILSVMHFAQYVSPFFVVYPNVIPRQLGLSIAQLLSRQRLLLHGYELRHLKYIPRILYVICERLLKLCGKHKTYSPGIRRQPHNSQIAINFKIDSTESFYKYFFSSANVNTDINRPHSSIASRISSGIASPDTTLTEINFSSDNSRSSTCDSKRIKKREIVTNSNILLVPCTSSRRPSLSPVKEKSSSSKILNDKNKSYEDIRLINAPMHQIGLVGLDTPKKSHHSSSSSDDRSDDRCSSSPTDSLSSIIEKTSGYRVLRIDSSHILCEKDFENSDKNTPFNSYLLENGDIDDEYFNDIDDDAKSSSGFISANIFSNIIDDEEYVDTVEDIKITAALAINYNTLNKSFLDVLTKYQKELNSKPSGWERLYREISVEILCALLWSWIENLNEPILNRNSLCYIVIKAEKPLDALLRLDQSVRYTVEYLIRFIARLRPDQEIQDILLRHLMAFLTKQRLKINNTSLVPIGKDWPEMRKGTAGKVMIFANGIYQLLI